MKEKKQDQMRNLPVSKLMLKMGIPMILSMMLQALYNIVDSAFVTSMPGEGVGQQALNALTYAFPVQIFMIAISIGTGVGVNALVSRYLGEGDREKASLTAGNGIFLAAMIYVVFLAFGIFAAQPFAASQTNDPVVAEMTFRYLRICCIFAFGNTFYAVFEKLLQATGRSHLSTIAQVGGAALNIVLDPIFIYDRGLGLGVEGAAWATAIGQGVAFLLGLVFHYRFNKEIGKSLKYVRPSGKLILGIYAIGLPAVIAQALMSVMTLGMNAILRAFDPLENYVSAYGIYYKIQQFVLFAAFGLRDAITPIVSYAYGMGSRERVRDGIKFGMLYTAVVMAIGTIILEAGATLLISAFGGLSSAAQSICLSAMRIISAAFLFAGVSVSSQGVFQAVGGNLQSLTVSLLRQAVLVLPVAYGFSLVVKAGNAGDWLIWFTFILAEVVTAAVAVVMLRQLYKKRIAVLGGEEVGRETGAEGAVPVAEGAAENAVAEDPSADEKTEKEDS